MTRLDLVLRDGPDDTGSELDVFANLIGQEHVTTAQNVPIKITADLRSELCFVRARARSMPSHIVPATAAFDRVAPPADTAQGPEGYNHE